MTKTAAAKKTARTASHRAAKRPAPTTKKTAAAKPRASLLGEHPVPAAKTAPEQKAPRAGTRWALALSLLVKGATNAELLMALRKAFGEDVPASYPTWYRSYAVKKVKSRSVCRSDSR